MAVRADLRVLELCAGSGHHGEAVRLVAGGARVVCYVEREVTAAAVLVARMADGSLDEAPVWTDLRTFDGGPWRGVVDLVIGGFPCQPYSTAGKRLGAEDERDLWSECLRVLLQCGARLAFFENVGGGLREYHRRFRPDLEGAGYRVAEVLLSASDVGAPHGRERLFFLAVADRAGIQPREAGELGPGLHATRWGGTGVADSGRAADERRGGPGGPPEPSGTAAGEARQRQRRRADVGSGGIELGNPARGDGQRSPSGHGGHAALAVQDVVEPVEDTDRQRGRRWATGRTDAAAGEATERDVLGAFPPGNPYDDHGNVGDEHALEQWRAILAVRPDLAPAVEPAVRGVADGVGRGMDLARADRLRILGNGVVPQAAALALRLLAGELGVTL